MNDIMGMVQEGVGLILQILIFAVLIFLRNFKNKVEDYYTSKMTNQQRLLLAQIGREAFAFAETVYRGHDGPAKLNEAIKYLLDRAREQGLGDVQMMDARAVIESAWLEDRRGTTLTVAATGVLTEPGVVAPTNTVSDEPR